MYTFRLYLIIQIHTSSLWLICCVRAQFSSLAKPGLLVAVLRVWFAAECLLGVSNERCFYEQQKPFVAISGPVCAWPGQTLNSGGDRQRLKIRVNQISSLRVI